MVVLSNKFLYESDEEFQIIDSQCEVCVHYNSGNYSDMCPKEKFEQIKKNQVFCEKKEMSSMLD